MVALSFWSHDVHEGQEEALTGVFEASALLHWAKGSFSLSRSVCEVLLGVNNEV